MVISDVPKATAYLERIGYYRLSGYWYPYRQSIMGPSGPVVQDSFRQGVDFGEIIDLYVFDKKLRMVMLDVIERIEIALRVKITLALGRYDPKAHRLPQYLHGNFARRLNPKTGFVDHREWLRRHDQAFDRSKEDFAIHFKAKYPAEDPPVWIAAELWDFGATSVLFGGLQKSDQTNIAATFGVPRFDIMETWVRAINIVRNICAHHSRLWNRPIVIQPKWPSPADCPELAHLAANIHGQTRLYGIAAICAFLLRSINPTSIWKQRFIGLMGAFPNSNIVNPASGGFPANWTHEPLWV